jgi:hypothetical protein
MLEQGKENKIRVRGLGGETLKVSSIRMPLKKSYTQARMISFTHTSPTPVACLVGETKNPKVPKLRFCHTPTPGLGPEELNCCCVPFGETIWLPIDFLASEAKSHNMQNSVRACRIGQRDVWVGG